MKILHLLSQHPESTGSGYWLQNMLRQAANRGHRNFLVAGLSPAVRPQLAGVAVEHCRFLHFGTPPLNFAIPGMSDVMPYPSSRFSALTASQLAAYELAFAEVIGTALDTFKPDIIHSHHLWLASAVARELAPELPMVTSCHSTELRQLHLCPHLRSQVLPACRRIDRVLALSLDQQQHIISQYGIDRERITLVGGGFADELFTFGKKEAPPPLRLLYAGKLSYAKGVDSLLRAFARLRESAAGMVDLELHLAGSGSGDEAAHCQKMAVEMGESVQLHGRVDQPQLARLMAAAHIFVLPSLYEGLPLVLLEALACGCRVVTTGLPGCHELLGDIDRELVEFVDLPALATIDRLAPGDEEPFAGKLAAALATMAERARRTPNPGPAALFAGLTAPHTWAGVFARVEAAYRLAAA